MTHKHLWKSTATCILSLCFWHAAAGLDAKDAPNLGWYDEGMTLQDLGNIAQVGMLDAALHF